MKRGLLHSVARCGFTWLTSISTVPDFSSRRILTRGDRRRMILPPHRDSLTIAAIIAATKRWPTLRGPSWAGYEHTVEGGPGVNSASITPGMSNERDR